MLMLRGPSCGPPAFPKVVLLIAPLIPPKPVRLKGLYTLREYRSSTPSQILICLLSEKASYRYHGLRKCVLKMEAVPRAPLGVCMNDALVPLGVVVNQRM